MTTDPSAPAFARNAINLADPRLGAKAIFATDEFFAAKERMLDPAPAAFIPGKYDENGKWMDGWESRRKRGEGHDHCVVRLGRPGTIVGIDVDTSHFTGNYPPAASLDACRCTGDPTDRTYRSDPSGHLSMPVRDSRSAPVRSTCAIRVCSGSDRLPSSPLPGRRSGRSGSKNPRVGVAAPDARGCGRRGTDGRSGSPF